MGNSRRLVVGLALLLSISWSGSAQEEPPSEEEKDPWAVLQTTPGVQVDRINVSGSDGSCGCSAPKPVVEAGAAVGQGFPEADQLVFGNPAADEFLPVGFAPFLRRKPEETGEADLGMPDPQLRFLSRHGTNDWEARIFLGGSGGEGADGPATADRFDSLRSLEAEAGGVLSKDRAWIWGGVNAHEVDRLVLGGQREEQDGWTGKLKLSLQLGKSASLIGSGRRGDSDGSGLGAAPGRAPETTWEEGGRETIHTAESAVIHNHDSYSILSLSTVDGHLDADPRSAGLGARIGADGVARGSWFGVEEERRTRQARLRSELFATTGQVSHDIALGAGWRRQSEERTLTPPDSLVVDGRILSLGAASPLLETWRAGTAGARTETLGLWAHDMLRLGKWTAFAGVQADRHDLGIDGGPSPWTVSPRLGMNWRPCCQTVVWASLGRFASRLGPRAAWHVDSDAPALSRALFDDRDGDLSFDPGEPLSPLPGEGIDPLRPGFDPDRIDSRLRPETIDDAVLGAEREWASSSVGLRVAWRRTSDLLEERLLVRDGATGEVFAATAHDWVPAGRLAGTLPDGTPYDVPFWDLRPGLVSTGGTLLVNGGRRQDDLALSLTWKKNLSYRWMADGQVTWRDGDRRLGSGFRRFDDPTNTLGGGDDEGDPVTALASGRPRETPRFVAPRWSFDAFGMGMLPRELRALVSVHGRRGDPLPYYRQVARERAGLTRVQLTEDADAFRTDDVITVDAALEREIAAGDYAFLLRLEALNLLDEATVLDRELDLGTGRAAAADATLAARTWKLVVKMWWEEWARSGNVFPQARHHKEGTARIYGKIRAIRKRARRRGGLMPQAMHARTRRMTIVAQDPAIRDEQGKIVTAEVEIPAERLAPGPCGYRVHVIDYDTASRTLYKPADLEPAPGARPLFENPGNDVILGDPRFHAQNVYAIVMRILGRFELALGRRVSWGFPSHQLKVAPHAFVDANAFYSERDEALVFGYFPGRDGKPVFSCLSHDVVAHEATHALIDGLRGRFTDPSSPDQAAFHEGFADVVALLSVFSLRDVVKATLDRSLEKGPDRPPAGLVHESFLSPEALRESVLLGLAQQMGEEMSLIRGQVLRRSIKLTPEEIDADPQGFREEHRRGEILVAAMLNAFLGVWTRRLESLGRIDRKYFDRERIAEEAADAADYLLTMSIRALDYTPPVHLKFDDFLSALLTADYVIRPDDSKYRYREQLRESFARYGIKPASQEGVEEGIWRRSEDDLDHDCIHFDSLTRDRDEVFRFVWENRTCLGLYEGAYTRVETLRPCLRTAPDGFILRETVVECTQQLEVPARKLRELDIEKPRGMGDETLVRLQGGLTLVFDQRGHLSFSISNRLAGDPVTAERQSRRLQDLWDYGQWKPGASLHRRFSVQHRRRALDSLRYLAEVW